MDFNLDREIRIFVSSTFRDMHEEREVLMKDVFPRLQDICEQHSITLFEVDLRWGIPSEESTENKILSTCLDEIDNCRPFFIGILGERYGWIPKMEDLPVEKKWLNNKLGKSVTEIEILHAISNNLHVNNNYAFFYFREPKYVDRVPKEKRVDFIESSPVLKDKLEDLKQKIRQSNLPLRENYKDPKEFGELVLEDFKKLINRIYPPNTSLTLEEKETIYHLSFAGSRSHFYIGGQKYLNVIKDHCNHKKDPLIITGLSGSGKSTLLANWILKYLNNNQEPNLFLFFHFIGANAASTSWIEIIKRLLDQLKKHFGFEEKIPTDPQLLTKILMNWLPKAAKKEKMIIVIDALDQLDRSWNQEDLSWLPLQITKYAILIMSTLPGKPMEALNKRGWMAEVLEIEPLSIEERRDFISGYFKQYSKKLNKPNIERIVNQELTSSPIFLKTLLNELRVFGKYDELNMLIGYLIESATIYSLFEKVLQRLEKDYDRVRPNLVKDVMCLIYVSRRGLNERELVDLLGIPTAHWSPLFLSMKSSFVSRSGYLDFFHNYFKEAVQKSYLSTKESEDDYRNLLIKYFNQQNMRLRNVEEVPWQMIQTKKWDELYQLLGDLEFIRKSWGHNPIDTKMYWSQLESSSNYKIISAYEMTLKNPQNYMASDLTIIFELLKGRYPKETINLGFVLSNILRNERDDMTLVQILIDLADNLRRVGKLEEGIKVLEESEAISKKIGDYRLLAEGRILRGVILKMLGHVNEAFDIYRESEEVCRKHGHDDILADSLFNLADIYYFKGEKHKSLALFNEAEGIYRKIGDQEFVGNTLNYMASILHDIAKHEQALAMFEETEELFKSLGYKNGFPKLYFNLGKLWSDKGQYEKALSYLNLSEKYSDELGKYVYQTRVYLEKAAIYTNLGNFVNVLSYLEKANELSSRMGFKEGQALYFCKKGQYLIKQNNIKEAISYFKKYELFSRELGFDEYVKDAVKLQSSSWSLSPPEE